ncbi:tripartite tricarboxylate transporter TctB family protein [Oceaniglobus trochenteri]|uniref:tripartite tricarboxylate transporter TctB family protein n=1 Tax=Oceaniglobus trochenteri TaxID=2763260 RepID=UPI001CFFC069|nr:tripartite tricarboxylate transporter TctB family protein [Oceaniglobus trochenteri]
MKRDATVLSEIMFLLIGIAFFLESLRIPTDSVSTLGAGFVPTWVSIILILLSGAMLLMRWKREGLFFPRENPDDNLQVDHVLHFTAPVIAIVLLYALVFVWTGYLISSLLAMFVSMLFFRNSLASSVVHSIIAAVLFYYSFIHLMGIYDPPGEYLDTSEFLSNLLGD